MPIRIPTLALATVMLAAASAGPAQRVEVVGTAERFAPAAASTRYSSIRLTLSPDGRTALWFSRDRPGGSGGYDIWMSRRTLSGWGPPRPVPFNSSSRDFDPAFSADGRAVYFCSDRPGGAGGDDIYRVPVGRGRFGTPVNLGSGVNSLGNEFSPMLSPDGATLLFSSDRTGGAGGHDLYTAGRKADAFAPAMRLPGTLNSAANEFDATYLRDGRTIVFARAMDFQRDRVDLYQSAPQLGGYGSGARLPESVNGPLDTYGAMLDWSDPAWLTFSGRRDAAPTMSLYRIRYRLVPAGG